MPKLIQSLGLLPCEPSDYLPNIVKILRIIYQYDESLNQNKLTPILKRDIGMSKKLSDATLCVCEVLELTVINQDIVTLSKLGHEFTKLEVVLDNNIFISSGFERLIHYLEDSYLGFSEVIHIFSKAYLSRSSSIVENKSYDVEERIIWLVALQILQECQPKYKIIWKTTQLLQQSYSRKSIFSNYNSEPNNIFDNEKENYEWLFDSKEDNELEEENYEWVFESEEDNELGQYPQQSFHSQDQAKDLKHELRDASADSNNPDRFENALARAFKFLGFEVEQFGQRNVTDVVVQATLGNLFYSVIVDAKSHKTGSFYDLEPVTLLEHKQKHKADYVVVVARRFGRGKVIRQATAHNITLLPLETLENWIDLHKELPQTVFTYKTIFKVIGEVNQLPDEILEAQNKRIHLTNAVSAVISLLIDGYTKNMSHEWTLDQIYAALNIRYEKETYSHKDVSTAIDFLTHPMIACASQTNNMIFLTANRKMLQDSLVQISSIL